MPMGSPHEEQMNDVDINDGVGQSYLNADERSGATTSGKPSFSIDRAGLQITGYDPDTFVPSPGWGGVAGRAVTVTYAYRSTEPTTMPTDTGGFQRFNSAQIIQAEKALQSWSDVANITFTRVGSGTSGDGAYSNNATILLSNYTSGHSGSAAFANFPGSTAATSAAGDVWINLNAGTNSAPAPGNYGAQVLVHELGHAAGLVHPGEYNANDGKAFTYQNDAEYYEDTRQYSVMSYFSEANTGGAYTGRYASTPQLDDIRALQYEYGANMTTRTGDTIYGFNSNAGREWFAIADSSSKVVFAVWDAGGTDTFDFSGYSQSALIDLRAGNFSSVGGLVGNVAIAQGATIENAFGGSGGDLIYGNAFDNRIFAGAGNDTINGGEGYNFLRGEDGNDSILGGSGADDLQGNMGNDTESGGAGNDSVVGGRDNDVLYGDAGDDFVYGNLGNDTLEGGPGADVIRGGQGDDQLNGGDGNDYISGDRGADTVVGGPGADIFHAFNGSGIDRVLDFRQSEGDRVFLDAGTKYNIAQFDGDTIITLGESGDQVTLVGVNMETLLEGWLVVG